MHRLPPKALLAPLLLLGCSDPPVPGPEVKPDPWSAADEVLYQTREVVRYVKEKRRQDQGELEALNVTTGAPRPPGDNPTAALRPDR